MAVVENIADGAATEADGLGAANPPAFVKVPNHGILTASLMLATIMQTLDTTIANVALPRMQGALSATQDEMGWVITSYVIASAITIPLAGWLASKFERRLVFLGSVVIFTIASALCGLAQTLPQLVLFRFLQGMGGAALLPLSQAAVFDINAPKDIGRAIAAWGTAANIGPILGPLLGGWLTDDYSWRWVYFINLPVGAVAFAGLFFALPRNRPSQATRFDMFGFITLSFCVGALQLLLDRGQILDWFASKEIVGEAAVAGLAFYLFLVHTLSTRQPFLNLSLFKDRNFVASSAFIILIGLVLFASLALFPPMLQDQLGYPVLLTGLVTAPRGLGTLIALAILGKFMGRADARAFIVTGLVTMAFASWQMTGYSLLMGVAPVVVSATLQGLGIGLAYTPLSMMALSTLPGGLRNEGAAFFNLLRYLGSSFGISVVMFLLTRNAQRMHAALSAHVTPYRLFDNPALQAAHVDAASRAGLAALNAQVTNQAMMIGYIDDFKLMTVLTLLTIPFVLLFRGARRQTAQ